MSASLTATIKQHAMALEEGTVLFEDGVKINDAIFEHPVIPQHNYCRNWNSKSTGIWCFTDEGEESCVAAGVRTHFYSRTHCDESDPVLNYGVHYRGCHHKTQSKKTCQNWDAQTPHTHNYGLDQYGTSGRHNYCRNPTPGTNYGQDTKLWCYTTDPDTRYETCDPPTTCEETLSGINGKDYEGCQTVTRGGITCSPWNARSSKDTIHDWHQIAQPVPEHNYCRNPNNGAKEIWCYTPSSWDFCDPIPQTGR
jgi:hypothetical protein